MEQITIERLLKYKIQQLGQKLPKKHGEWYRLNIYDDTYLVYDTWNGQVYHYKGAIPSGTDNMYRVVYTFSGYIETVKGHMFSFWNGHINL